MLINLGKKIQHGFTIVELLVVIVVIGILAAITIVSYTGITSRATASALQSDLTNASSQLKLYQIDHSAYPTSLNASNCPLDSSGVVDSTYCIKPTSGNTFLYSSNNNSNPQTFSLYAINTSTSTKYRTTNDSSPTVATPVVATGGTITNIGGYRIHTFTTSGTFTVTSGDNVEVLVVGGGGGAGSDVGGGGGGGGVLYNPTFAVAQGAISVTVGSGGLGYGGNGVNSVFSTMTAIGGGGGGTYSATAGKPGGSGGGGGGGGVNPGGSGTTGQGNNGGNGSAGAYASGAGGGAGGMGNSASITTGLDGGIGLAYSITGTPTYYGGGGGGGGSTAFGQGGLGGGGLGEGRTANNGQNGAANTGGGAGGAASPNTGGATGGSGIVIVRYPI